MNDEIAADIYQAELLGARFCCDELRGAAVVKCDSHPWPYDCPDVLVVWSRQFCEFGLPIRDSGSSFVSISFCPFCGTRLS